MSSEADLVPLRKTVDALREIRSALVPFLKLLRRGDGRGAGGGGVGGQKNGGDGATDPARLAEARAATAVAMGTLRYMAARLKGQDRGRKKDDPLRMELDKMRRLLVTLRGLEGKGKKKNTGGRAAAASVSPVARGGGSKGKRKAPPQPAPAVPTKKEKVVVAARDGAKGGKVLDVRASERMVKAALAGEGGGGGSGVINTTPLTTPRGDGKDGGGRAQRVAISIQVAHPPKRWRKKRRKYGEEEK